MMSCNTLGGIIKKFLFKIIYANGKVFPFPKLFDFGQIGDMKFLRKVVKTVNDPVVLLFLFISLNFQFFLT